MAYQIVIVRAIQKQINKLPADVQSRVDEKIQRLKTNPRSEGVKKLKGYDSEYRIRVGSYRIRYDIDDEQAVVRILQCRHRKDVYRDRD